MPKTSHTHKSMLLRGAKLPTPALNRSDIEIMKGRSRRGGRNFGGAPLGRSDQPPVHYGPNGQSQRGGYRGGYRGGGSTRGGYSHHSSSFPGPPPPGWHPSPPGAPGFGMGVPPPPPPAHYQPGGYNNSHRNGRGPPGGSRDQPPFHYHQAPGGQPGDSRWRR